MPPAPPLHKTDGLANIIGWLGTLASVALFGSPVPTFMKIRKERTTGTFAFLPYGAGMLNAASWVSYSIVTPERYQTAVTNLVGAALMLVWLVMFVKYSSNRGVVLAKIFLVFAAWASMTIAAIFLVRDDWFTPLREGETCRTEFAGLCCIAFNILMYGAPLGAARRVINTRSVESMPIALSVAGLASSILWALYATLLSDRWVGIPNYIGTVLGLIQIAIYLMYCRHSQSEEQRLVQNSTSLQPTHEAC
mmetsp:Transcript_18965/g.40747  ORF Transcript_18965/g.40747 Transcript_18965/m.40747 type:complete len:250 (+) Transcript_18965:146-895(+)